MAGALSVGGYKLYKYIEHERQARVVAELALVGQKQVNDSTVAKLTRADVDKVRLAGALEAAHALNGRLIAAVGIRVPARETIFVDRALPTTVDTTDKSRTATFKDSTFAGIVTGTVTAPPYPDPLRVQYSVLRPEFSPSVGLVQVGDTVVATVTWQGEHVDVQAPFYHVPKPPVDRVGAFLEADYGVMGARGLTLRGGAFLQPLRGLKLQASAQQEIGDSASIRVGVRKEF